MSPAASAPRVFVSYARSDGEVLARRLRQRLEAAQVPLWQDHESLEGGRDWWLQITAAIDRVEFLVLVMTPAALQSAMVRREWRYARQRGVTVYPVMGGKTGGDDGETSAAPAIDFSTLPRWMRSVHFYNLDQEWRKFVNDLHSRPTPVRVPFMVEDLPPDFVPRPREYALLADQLLDRSREEPIAITTALRGAGGFGKTALARALCHDEAIQNAFDDGVLWVTLGERPGDLTARVVDLIYMLTGQRPGFAGLETAVAALAELLADRDMLIVIDDAWDAAHVQPFLQGGERCARIITTRIADVLPAGTRRIDVDAMAQAEAVALLGQGLPEGANTALAALAARLGEWPLLLKLVNGALRERVRHQAQPLPGALAYVNKVLDKRGLTSFDARDAVARHAAVATTLGVSLAQLTPDELARLDELAVFPEDVDLPLATLASYWARSAALDELDTEMLCERLARLSLLLAFDPTLRFLRLHDVIRRYLLLRVAERQTALHRLLLDAARPASGIWADLPADDPYWWQWLFVHLHAAGRTDELLHTALDLRYLANKAAGRTAFSVESDLRLAEAQCPHEPRLALLRRSYGQSAHLFGDCRTAAQARATLISRLQDVPGLAALAAQAAATLHEPRLVALHPLPDLPHPALVRTLGSHRGAVRACAISADGRLIATAASHRQISLWDGRTGSELRSLVANEAQTFSGHSVRALAFSQDGRWLLAAAGDRRLWLWDTDNGTLRHQLLGHTDAVTDCAISADGSLILSSSLDCTLKVWNAHDGTLRHTLGREWANNEQGWRVPVNDQGHWSAVQGCALSADGRIAASASADQTLILWDTTSGRALRVLTGHTETVNACAFSPDGQTLVSAGSDRTLRIWDCRSGEHRALAAHRHAVNACAFSAYTAYRPYSDDSGQGQAIDEQALPDEQEAWIVSASADGTLRLWSSDGDELLQTLSGHTDWVNDCAVSAAAGLIVSAANDGTAKVWDMRALPEPLHTGQHEGWVQACAAVPQRNLLVTAGQDHTLMLWDVRRGQSRRRWLAHEASVRACAVSADGLLLASGAADGTLLVWDGVSASRTHTLVGHRGWVNACAFHPGGSLLASVSNDCTLRLWDLRTRSRKLALLAHRMWINSCSVSPDGRFVVTAAADGGLTRWSLDFDEALWEAWLVSNRPLPAELAETALQALPMDGHEASVNHCTHAPDGSFVVSAGSDAKLKIWDAHTGVLRRTLSGHLEAVNGCAVSADSQRIVSVSSEGGIKVWRVADGQCLMSIQVDGSLSACVWTGEGESLAAVGSRGVYAFACRSGLDADQADPAATSPSTSRAR